MNEDPQEGTDEWFDLRTEEALEFAKTVVHLAAHATSSPAVAIVGLIQAVATLVVVACPHDPGARERALEELGGSIDYARSKVPDPRQ